MGCSNAVIARQLQAKVLLVCKPGLGDCVDSFNLCRQYFTSHSCSVLGVVVNKIPPPIMNKTKYVRKYFDQQAAAGNDLGRVYGLVGTSEHMAEINKDKDDACRIAFKRHMNFGLF